MNSNDVLTVTVYVVVLAILGTIALAAISYLAFRIRERRRPVWQSTADATDGPIFFERVRFPKPEERMLTNGKATHRPALPGATPTTSPAAEG